MSVPPESLPHAELPFEELLSHQGFLFSLARRLVGNDQDADDLAQEAWLATLQGPLPRGANLRAWLRRVARNSWLNRKREEGARTVRERSAARPEAFDPEPAERGLEQRQQVLEAVRTLPEPYRTTIFLRYYEECSYADVAARTGASEDTARSRVRRGIALLRERLDRSFGSRGAWLAALAEWRGPGDDAGTATAVAGQPALAPLPAWIGAAALTGSVALLALLGWHAFPERAGSELPTPAARAAGQPRADFARPELVSVPRASVQPLPAEPQGLASGAPGPVNPGAAPTAPRGFLGNHESVDHLVHGRVVGPDGLPIAGASLYTALVGWTATDAEGRFEVPVEINTYRSGGSSTRPSAALLAHSPGFTPALVLDVAELMGDDPSAPQRIELSLGPPPRSVAGVVMTAAGQPATGWRVALLDSTASFPGAELARVTLESLAGGQPRVLEVDAAGSFRIDGLSERPYRVIAWDPRSLQRVVGEVGSGSPIRLELRAPDPGTARRVAGRVVSRSGAPLVGARVWARLPLLEERHEFMPPESAHGAQAVSDALGHFELEMGLHEPLPLVVAGEGLVVWRHGSAALRTTDDWESLELVVPRRCEVVLDAQSPAPPAALLAFLDAAGEKLLSELPPEEHAAMGGLGYWRAVPLREGIERRSVHTNEDAVTALFYDVDGTEIERRAVSPDPDRPTVLTW